jgi:hypothetical protein
VEGLDSLRRLARQLQPATETAPHPEPAR